MNVIKRAWAGIINSRGCRPIPIRAGFSTFASKTSVVIVKPKTSFNKAYLYAGLAGVGLAGLAYWKWNDNHKLGHMGSNFKHQMVDVMLDYVEKEKQAEGNGGTVTDVLGICVSQLPSIIMEEAIKRACMCVHPVLVLVLPLWEWYAIYSHQNAFARVGVVVMHVTAAVVPFPLGVIIHAVWNMGAVYYFIEHNPEQWRALKSIGLNLVLDEAVKVGPSYYQQYRIKTLRSDIAAGHVFQSVLDVLLRYLLLVGGGLRFLPRIGMMPIQQEVGAGDRLLNMADIVEREQQLPQLVVIDQDGEALPLNRADIIARNDRERDLARGWVFEGCVYFCHMFTNDEKMVSIENGVRTRLWGLTIINDVLTFLDREPLVRERNEVPLNYRALVRQGNIFEEYRDMLLPLVTFSLRRGVLYLGLRPRNLGNCPICLEVMEPNPPFGNGTLVQFQSCLHWMHEECAMEYIRHSNECPICREFIIGIHPHDDEVAEYIQLPLENRPIEAEERDIPFVEDEMPLEELEQLIRDEAEMRAEVREMEANRARREQEQQRVPAERLDAENVAPRNVNQQPQIPVRGPMPRGNGPPAGPPPGGPDGPPPGGPRGGGAQQPGFRNRANPVNVVENVNARGEPIPGNMVLENRETRNLAIGNMKSYRLPRVSRRWDGFGYWTSQVLSFVGVNIPRPFIDLDDTQLVYFHHPGEGTWYQESDAWYENELPEGLLYEMIEWWHYRDHTIEELIVSARRCRELLRNVDIDPVLKNHIVMWAPATAYYMSAGEIHWSISRLVRDDRIRTRWYGPLLLAAATGIGVGLWIHGSYWLAARTARPVSAPSRVLEGMRFEYLLN